MNEKSAPAIKRPTLRPRALFGPPALIDGEDPTAYNLLRDRITAAVQPADIIEEILVRELVDLVWQNHRWRRLMADFLKHRAYGKSLPRDSWSDRMAPEDKAIQAEFEEADTDRDDHRDDLRQTFSAIALAENLDCIIGMDQLSASAQRQFNATLREIERHRQTLGLSVRPAGLPSVEPKVKVLRDPKDIA